jgi:hypothetical protein
MAYTDIDKPTEHFTTFLWTGNDASSRSFTGVGFQANMMWSKNRSSGHQHNLVDTVRGVDQKLIMPSDNNDEDTTCTHGHFDSLDSDGFTVTNAGGGYNVNRNANNFVGWFWKGNGSGSSNTDGSITSTVSANTTSGFSIVKYTGTESAGATVGHGLGVAPDVIIVKNYAVTKEWNVYHSANTSTPQNDYLILNEDNATNSNSGRWNNTAPSSSIFTLGDGSETNGSGNTHIAYCFAEKKGFSKFGSYTGNGSTDGIFVYTGFKPAFTLIKKSSASGTWWEMVDNKRSPSNVMDNTLYANVTNSEFESSAYNRDFVSNGFKIRNTNGGDNTSGATYVYMAFAETPFVTSTGIPTTAK